MIILFLIHVATGYYVCDIESCQKFHNNEPKDCFLSWSRVSGVETEIRDGSIKYLGKTHHLLFDGQIKEKVWYEKQGSGYIRLDNCKGEEKEEEVMYTVIDGAKWGFGKNSRIGSLGSYTFNGRALSCIGGLECDEKKKCKCFKKQYQTELGKKIRQYIQDNDITPEQVIDMLVEMSWDNEKVEILEAYLSGKQISCEQLSKYLKILSWDSARLKVCRLVKLTDPHNISKVANSMEWDSSKSKLFEIFF